MKFEKVIVLPVYKRADYTRQVLEHLKDCWGIEKYKIFASCEPGHPEVVNVITQCELPIYYKVHTAKLGCSGNIYTCLDVGFGVSDFVILVEDDILLARDALLYFEWAAEKYANDSKVYTVGAFTRHKHTLEMTNQVERGQWFTPWGWATWVDRFAEMAKTWDMSDWPHSWDQRTNIARGVRFEIRPMLSRSQNIGAQGGTYCTPSYHEAHVKTKLWAGMPEVQLTAQPAFVEI